MYSSEDLERFYFQYQTEGLRGGISIQDFCIKNKVPYTIFSKWYKDTRKKIVEVKVDGFPSGAVSVLSSPVTKEPENTGSVVTPTRIWVELRMSTGMHISQKNLTYQELTRMIEKLEVLLVQLYRHALQAGRILSVIREQLHREPNKGDVYIVLSKNRLDKKVLAQYIHALD